MSVAAMSAATACPAANAASANAPGAHGAQAAPGRAHGEPRRRPQPRPAPRGPYVYEIYVGGEVSVETANTRCSGDNIRLTGVTLVMPETQATTALFYRNESYWGKRATITAGPAARITVSWTPPAERREAEGEANAHNGEIRNPRLQGQEDTGTAGAVCAATTPNAALGDIGRGYVTWRLPRPVASVAALLAQPATSVSPDEYMLVFEILPDGTVPAFTPDQT